MSRFFSVVILTLFSLFISGCATDDYARQEYARHTGSLKDSHAQTSQNYKRKAARRFKRRYVKQSGVRRKAARGGKGKPRYYSIRENKIVSTKPEIEVEIKQAQRVKEAAQKQKAQSAEEEPAKETVENKIKKAPIPGQAQTEQIIEPVINKQTEIAKRVPLPEVEKKEPVKRSPTPSRIMPTPAREQVKTHVVKEKKATPQKQKTRKREVKIAKATERKVLSEKQDPVARIETTRKKSIAKKQDKALALRMEVEKLPKLPGKIRSFQSEAAGENSKPYSVIKVYYATDRGLSGRLAPKHYYGSKRGPISYGMCEVSIPKSHKLGEIEAPSIWRLEFREDPKKHVVLKSVKRRDKTLFFAEIKKNLSFSKGKNAMVFVHGYNIEFHEAALRTAQMAYDLKFDGVPLFYSWPSQGTYEGYTRDEANVRWTQANLKRFMRDFVKRSDAENIYLIAHSMGARALTGAVAELVEEMPSLRSRIKEIMLAAPDIDAEIFKRDIAPKLVKASRNVTLYASAEDRALQASKTLHGEPRAGDAGDSVVVFKGIDTIDATGIDTSLFGHTYFAEAPTILSDILAIIHHGRRPKDRPGLIPVLASEGQYWAFRKNSPTFVNGTTIFENVVRELDH